MTKGQILQRARNATVAFVLAPPGEMGNMGASMPDALEGMTDRFPQVVGSGVAVAENPRVIVTARHVVAGAQAQAFRIQAETGLAYATVIVSTLGTRRIQRNGSEVLEVVYVGSLLETWQVPSDPSLDLAVVVTPPGSPPCPVEGMPIDESVRVREGMRVATCGWPYGTRWHEDNPPVSSFLWGNISLVAPHPHASRSDHRAYWAQMPVNPGNSGGGVFCVDTGNLVGIASRRFLDDGVSSGIAEIVPITQAVPAITESVARCKTP